MNITEFLEARIAEDEAGARRAALDRWGQAATEQWDWASNLLSTERDSTEAQDAYVVNWWPARVLAECAAKRAIIKQHEEWPVLVEREPSELESVAAGLESITYRMTREIAWLTEREYIKRFGTQPPTAPMICTLAAVYADHPDYQQEWAK